ncbi:exonuclease [Rhizobium phage RHph_N34]|uniref:Putative exonuclease protein n=1 Tax=Rhizobium phage RHph_N34 TaxID=2509586 RepID=A0A7S5RJ43_9CAUD|nr:exonuclease [Rhizobium phage RHph_N34]QIG74014.1 putative exonuclease protein [Rhizobium phage RHph_N34]
MSFAALKRQFVQEPERRFVHISDRYTLPEGWVNDDQPTGRVYKNPLFPDDKFYSVTTMLGKIASMKGEDKWLEDWRARVGDEAADRISKEATDRGSAMHDYLEKYLSNKTVVNKHLGAYRLFRLIKEWCDTRVDAVICLEHALYSRRLRIAGRVDMVAILDGGGDIDSGLETLVDFKSSRKIKTYADIPHYMRQVTLYSMLFEETTGVRLELGEIWMGADNNGDPQALKFEVIFDHYRETVIDELAEYWEAQGDPLDIDDCKSFFLN